ncbi:hypothetical protein AVEN_30673-1 [Araneus ventricosus]|uniref:Uncharacterized protein n=1 Tax=Araneus ventricosus TaxID=182803 RepID=A0A4Y2IWQ8_ARAVE|nr:hypothetical protein AVEN_30673-1 [Araneus ventricosus]
MKRKKLLDGTNAVGLEKPISANESMYIATVHGDSPYVKLHLKFSDITKPSQPKPAVHEDHAKKQKDPLNWGWKTIGGHLHPIATTHSAAPEKLLIVCTCNDECVQNCLEEGGGLITAGESSKSSDMSYSKASSSDKEEELISASASDSRDCKTVFSNGGRTAKGLGYVNRDMLIIDDNVVNELQMDKEQEDSFPTSRLNELFDAD